MPRSGPRSQQSIDAELEELLAELQGTMTPSVPLPSPNPPTSGGFRSAAERRAIRSRRMGNMGAGAGAVGGLMGLASKAALPLAVAYGASELAGGVLPYFLEPKSVTEDRKLQREAMKNESLANAMLLQTQLSERERGRLDAKRASMREDRLIRESMGQQERQEMARQALMSMALDNENLATLVGAGRQERPVTQSLIENDMQRLAAQSQSRSPWELLGLR